MQILRGYTIKNTGIQFLIGSSKVLNMMSNKITGIRLREQDRKLLRELAEMFGVSESDVIKIALREFAANHGVETRSNEVQS